MATAASENAVEEDAAELVFPPEFEKADTKTLLISEVHILLEHRKQVRVKWLYSILLDKCAIFIVLLASTTYFYLSTVFLIFLAK